jgi:DsbC/DsbD-like thiol-disulfide interchange protein
MEAMTLRHHRCGGGAAVALLVLLSATTAAAQGPLARTASAPHVSVEIITDTDRPRAGTQGLGLRFTLEPGWHLYWVNPGDGGAPPEATWHTPAGMTATPFEWPLPERIDSNGLVNYGYRGTVLLPLRLAVAADIASAPAAIRADVRWLVCKDMCVSGRGTVELRWPLARADHAQVPAWAAAIAAARAKVPPKAPPAWTATAASTPDAFTLEIRSGRREEAATFFPREAGQIEDSAAQQITPIPDGVRIRLPRSAQLAKDPASLSGVVVFPDGRAFSIDPRLPR